MYPENPGVSLYRQHIRCIATGSSVAGMGKALTDMARVGLKLAAGRSLTDPPEECLIPQGYKKNVFSDRTGAQRAVDMLVARLSGGKFATEIALPEFESVNPAAAVPDLAHATIALVTEGGIVPRGNPDRLESARASKFLRYSIEGLPALSSESHQSVHGGYDNTFANADPNRVVPLDVVRDLVSEGKIGEVYPYYYTTTGNGTSLSNGKEFGAAIAAEIKQAGVDAVLLTAT